MSKGIPVSLSDLPPMVEWSPGKFIRKDDPRLAKLPLKEIAPVTVGQRTAPIPSKDMGTVDSRPEWRIRGFDSKQEMLYVDEYLDPRKMAGEIKWYHEPSLMKLYDGSGERSCLDFFIIDMKSGNNYWVDVKPAKFIPKEARLGMSKLKRVAKQIREFFGQQTFKATRQNGHWVHELVETNGER